MSKIALTPNANGTGVLTVASPNTNSNQTLTLPDNTGTFLTTGATVTLAQGGTSATSAPAAMANLMGFTTTATAAGTTTFTNTSSYYQIFTGITTQTIQLPVVSTLSQGWTFHICNNSTGNLTVNSSGGNLVGTVLPGITAMVTCILTTGTDAASWEWGITDFSTVTGTGSAVLSTSPSLTTPTILTNATLNAQAPLRFADADSSNYVSFQAPATVSANVAWTLPSADGTSGQFLQTNGSGTLAFATSGTTTIDTYTSGSPGTGTWTKPSTFNWVLIELWGGGGSGGKGASNTPCGGGGGGAYNFLLLKAADISSSTITYSVGAGGAAQTSAGAGNVGGTSSVTITNLVGGTKTIYAYGGGAGGYNASGGRGGGGGGILGAGQTGGTNPYSSAASTSTIASPANGTGGAPTQHVVWTSGACVTSGTIVVNPFGGGMGGGSYIYPLSTLYSAPTLWGNIYGGGGGGHAIDGAGTTAANAGSSVYGGGGGGGAANSGTAGVGGTSIYGGSGSNGTIDTNDSAAGSAPGGGSGGTEGGNSGAGGGGQVQFTYW